MYFYNFQIFVLRNYMYQAYHILPMFQQTYLGKIRFFEFAVREKL